MATAANTGEISTRVLIADADSAGRARYAASCLAEGWDVVEASNGRDAMVRALTRPPSIALIDLHLPVIDGFALCEILRKDRVTATAPIIAVTDARCEADGQRALRAGADVVITKPTPSETVIVEAHRLLSRSRELWHRAEAASAAAAGQTQRTEALLTERQRMKSPLRRHVATTTPPIKPPTLRCLDCEDILKYQRSYVGGVSDRRQEQWDYYTCDRCGTFQYRPRTRKLRRVR